MTSGYYKLWSWSGSAWVQVSRFRDLTFDRTLNDGGNISFVTARSETWGTHFTSGAENRHIRVTLTDSTTGDNGTIVDDFVVRVVEDDVLNRENLSVKGATLEVLLKDMKIPYRLKYRNRNAYLIFYDTGTSIPTTEVSGNGTGNMSIVGTRRSPITSSSFVAQVDSTPSSTLTTNGKYDTSGDAGTALTEFNIEMESVYSAISRLADQSKCYFRARASGASAASGKPSAVAIDFYNRTAGGVITRRAGGTGLETSNPSGGVDNARVLKMPQNCTYFVKYQDVERKADKVYVVGGSDGQYQNVQSSGSDSFREQIYYTPDLVETGALSSLATRIQGIWSTAARGDRFVATMAVQSLYSSTFDAELGDTVAVQDISANVFTGAFVRYVYRQSGEVHDVYLAYLGSGSPMEVSKAIDTAIREVRNTQGAHNWNSVPMGANSSSSRPLVVPFNIATQSRQISSVEVGISAATTQTDQSSGGSSGDVSGTSGSGNANVSETSTGPVISSIVVQSGTHVTVSGSSSTTVTMSASLPAADFGYMMRISVLAVDSGNNVLSGIITNQVTALMGYFRTGATFPAETQLGGPVAVWVQTSDGFHRASYVSRPSSNYSGYVAELVIQNFESSTKYYRVYYEIQRFLNHTHNPSDSGHSGHLDGTYSASIPSLATSLSGGSATTATVDIHISKNGGAYELVSSGVSVPTTGTTVSIPIGSGSGQIPASQTGQCAVKITPTGTVFLAGEVSVKSRVSS